MQNEMTDDFVDDESRKILNEAFGVVLLYYHSIFLEGLTYLLTYLLTPWSRVLLEKLTSSAASQEIPRIFGTPRFITVLTSARHLSLS